MILFIRVINIVGLFISGFVGVMALMSILFCDRGPVSECIKSSIILGVTAVAGIALAVISLIFLKKNINVALLLSIISIIVSISPWFYYFKD
jgi:hypothetical protein